VGRRVVRRKILSPCQNSNPRSCRPWPSASEYLFCDAVKCKGKNVLEIIKILETLNESFQMFFIPEQRLEKYQFLRNVHITHVISAASEYSFHACFVKLLMEKKLYKVKKSLCPRWLRFEMRNIYTRN
jgi:hypothetical protein